MKTLPAFYNCFIFMLALTVVGFTGCSGIKTYPNTLGKNVKVRTTTSSDSFFSSVGATVDIYSVDSKCKITYEGTVQLDEPSVAIGIPVRKMSYIDFVFASSSFMGSSSATITEGTLLKPRSGYKYDVTATYQDSIYNVEIIEISPKRGKKRNIELKDLNQCKP